jgi:hypothetical protein
MPGFVQDKSRAYDLVARLSTPADVAAPATWRIGLSS